MCSTRQTKNINAIITCFLLLLVFDATVLGKRILWKDEGEVDAETTVLRHFQHHKNMKKKDIVGVNAEYSKPRTNVNYQKFNFHHKTTTTLSAPIELTSTTTQAPIIGTSTATKKFRTSEEHRLRHSNKLYQTVDVKHDSYDEKNNFRLSIDQSSHPTSNPWRKLVSSSNYKHHSKQPSDVSKDLYNGSKLLQNRLFPRDSLLYLHRSSKPLHPYDVLKVPENERVRPKPVPNFVEHNEIWDDSRFMNENDSDENIDDLSTKKRHLTLKSNNRKGKEIQNDYSDRDYYDDKYVYEEENESEIPDKTDGFHKILKVSFNYHNNFCNTNTNNSFNIG